MSSIMKFFSVCYNFGISLNTLLAHSFELSSFQCLIAICQDTDLSLSHLRDWVFHGRWGLNSFWVFSRFWTRHTAGVEEGFVLTIRQVDVAIIASVDTSGFSYQLIVPRVLGWLSRVGVVSCNFTGVIGSVDHPGVWLGVNILPTRCFWLWLIRWNSFFCTMN